MEPTRQRYLNISFALVNGVDGLDFLTLPVKPEELTRNEPSRTNVVNSLDGAWVDSFGRGLATLTISGNTGWRDRMGTGDGIEQFTTLRDNFIHKWHALRTENIAAGKDPDEVRLLFLDPLNGQYVADVVPTNFTLRRSKSQPLLLLYSISLTAVSESAFNPWPELMMDQTPSDPTGALTESQDKSLSDSVSTLGSIQKSLAAKKAEIGKFGNEVRGWTEKTFLPAVTQARDIIKTAKAAKEVISAAGQQVVNFAADLSAIGTTMWGAVAEVASLPLAAKAEVMRAKSAISNIQCVLVNGFQQAMSPYGYADVYGASNCSSTAGGSPSSKFAQSNTFEVPGVAPKIIVNAKAQAALAEGKAIDPAQEPDMAKLTAISRDIAGGVSYG